MKITVIYDTNNKSIVYKSVQYIIKTIQRNHFTIYIDELFIHDDFKILNSPLYSSKSSFYHNSFKITYPSNSHEAMINKISSILNKSDFIILASSNLNSSSHMYNLLERLSYQWLPHKLNSLMTNKIALAISDTSSLSFFSYANMFLSRNLRFWGINKRSIFSKSLSKYNSKNLSKQKQRQLYSELNKLSLKIINRYKLTSNIIVPNFKNKNYTNADSTYNTTILNFPCKQ